MREVFPSTSPTTKLSCAMTQRNCRDGAKSISYAGPIVDLLSAYLGRRAAGRAALRLSRPAVARPADLAGFLADFLAATFADVFFADVFTTFLADFAAA